MITTRIRATRCPYCGNESDAISTIANKHRPKPGSIIVCLYCAGLQSLDDAGNLIELSDERFAKLRADKPRWKAIEQVREAARITILERAMKK